MAYGWIELDKKNSAGPTVLKKVFFPFQFPVSETPSQFKLCMTGSQYRGRGAGVVEEDQLPAAWGCGREGHPGSQETKTHRWSVIQATFHIQNYVLIYFSNNRTLNYFLVTKGNNFTTKLQKLEVELTPEMLLK